MVVTVSITVLKRYARLLAIKAWSNMNRRAGGREQASYVGIEVRMTREEFNTWAIPEYLKWFQEHPEESPSIDRIDPAGHYELSNIRLMEVWENRTSNKRNKHRLAPEGSLHCRFCKQYLPTTDFYERPSMPLTAKNTRSHWSAECRKCSSEFGKAEREAINGKPSGICQRCGRELPSTAEGKVSRAKHCESCRHVLWLYKDRETPPQVNEHIREAMARKKRETGSVFNG